MARLDKVHEIQKGSIVCNPGISPKRYQTTEDATKVTCVRCAVKRFERELRREKATA